MPTPLNVTHQQHQFIIDRIAAAPAAICSRRH